jgi:PPOX class probable F420-dependent enzyme
MPMDISKALAFIALPQNQPGTLATLHPDGGPHLSVVTGVVVDGKIWVSVTQSRVKTSNVRKNPRVAFSAGIKRWAAVEGTAALREGEGVLEELREYYRLARGEHPDWEDYDRAMIADRRLILQITPIRAYGAYV